MIVYTNYISILFYFFHFSIYFLFIFLFLFIFFEFIFLNIFLIFFYFLFIVLFIFYFYFFLIYLFLFFFYCFLFLFFIFVFFPYFSGNSLNSRADLEFKEIQLFSTMIFQKKRLKFFVFSKNPNGFFFLHDDFSKKNNEFIFF